jgi:hypothetical protein
MVRPSALAVLRLMTRSNLVGRMKVTWPFAFKNAARICAQLTTDLNGIVIMCPSETLDVLRQVFADLCLLAHFPLLPATSRRVSR